MATAAVGMGYAHDGASPTEGTGMESALITVAERLASEFGQLPNSTVVRVVTDSVDATPDADHMFIEQAARARLTELAEDSRHAHE